MGVVRRITFCPNEPVSGSKEVAIGDVRIYTDDIYFCQTFSEHKSSYFQRKRSDISRFFHEHKFVT